MDFKIRIAQQSDSAELRDLYKNTVLVVNRRDYSQDEVEDWASCGDDLSNIEEMIKTHYFHPLRRKAICTLCSFTQTFKAKALQLCFWKK